MPHAVYANSYQEQPARLFFALINTNYHALQCLFHQFLEFVSRFLMPLFSFHYSFPSSFHHFKKKILFGLCHGFHIDSLLWIATIAHRNLSQIQPCPEKDGGATQRLTWLFCTISYKLDDNPSGKQGGGERPLIV